MLWRGFELFEKHFGRGAKNRKRGSSGPKPGQHVTSGDQKAWKEFVEEKRRASATRP